MVAGLHALLAAEEPLQRPEGWIRQCDADIAHDAAARVGAVTVPVLVVVGDDDICTPPRYARELCSLLQSAELATIPEAAHGAMGEKAHEVNAVISAFLKRH
jgi:pimeloyl-ACP methyl ester carboxylesterase